jgi:hypothetical protein
VFLTAEALGKVLDIQIAAGCFLVLVEFLLGFKIMFIEKIQRNKIKTKNIRCCELKSRSSQRYWLLSFQGDIQLRVPVKALFSLKFLAETSELRTLSDFRFAMKVFFLSIQQNIFKNVKNPLYFC